MNPRSSISPMAPVSLNAIAVATSDGFVLPDVPRINKMAVWKGPDGRYHETIDSIKAAMTEVAIKEFAAANNITDVSALATALAANLSLISQRVNGAIS